MNHSCKPTCAVEFDYGARIFVLQQPYVDVNTGAGWCGMAPWMVRVGTLARHRADDLIPGLISRCPGEIIRDEI